MLFVTSIVVIAMNLPTFLHAMTTPKDVNNCRLNSSSPFAWVVQIWDEQKPGGAGTASIGSLISHRAVLTTAWYFSLSDTVNNLDRYTVYGQNIWNYSEPPDYETARTKPCRQERKIRQILLHPKAVDGGELGRLLFDFSIINLVEVFNISSSEFPVMKFPDYAVTFIFNLKRIDSLQPPPCEMPTPENDSNRFLVFGPSDRVRPLPFRDSCIHYICQKNGTHLVDPGCFLIFWMSAINTMLCMIPEWTKSFEIDAKPTIGEFPNYLAGIPLVCRGLTYGISTQVKQRTDADYQDFQQSFFFVITFLRVWEWLKTNILIYSVDPEHYTSVRSVVSQTFYDPPIPSVSGLDFDPPKRPNARLLRLNPDRKANSASERSCFAMLTSVGAAQLLLMRFS